MAQAEGGDELPEAWEAEVKDGLLDLELFMTEGPDPTLIATARGHDVLYRPGPDEGPPCP